MLPDYIEIKEKVSKALRERMRNIVYQPPFDKIRTQSIIEGDEWCLIYSDGSIYKSGFKDMESELMINLRAYEDLTFDEILKKVDECALKMAEQFQRNFFESFEEGVKKVGNDFNCEGKPFSPEKFFEIIKALQMDFKRDGSPEELTLMGGEIAKKAMEEVKKQIYNDPILLKQYREIMEIKKDEWRDRESSRKLVG